MSPPLRDRVSEEYFATAESRLELNESLVGNILVHGQCQVDCRATQAHFFFKLLFNKGELSNGTKYIHEHFGHS